MATTFQQASRLEQFGAEHTYLVLQKVWLQPYGHPLVIEADDDRNFGGYFKEMVENAGTHLLIVPAEAHWRIGTVERRNAILRTIAERMIDERAVTDGLQLDMVMIAACQAVNSSTTSRGRTPYQAVFGKVPRFPGDHLGDERSLLVSHDFNFTEELRCQALRIIAEMRASHVIRRALLRKTASSRQEAQSILPGSMAAYWRWSKKGKGRKRGGYVLGRLLNHDPDQKSAWIHNGSSVVQVTHEQLRPAFGIESWSPSSQDIQILKDGAKKMQDNLWEDERGPAPPLTESLDVEVEASAELVMPLAPPTPSPVPATPAPPPPLPPQLPLSGQQQPSSLPQPLVFSPRYSPRNIQNIHQHFGPERSSSNRQRDTPYTATSTQAQHAAIEPPAQQQLSLPNNPEVIMVEDEDTNMTEPQQATIQDAQQNNTATHHTAFMTDNPNEKTFQIYPVEQYWDGRPSLPVPEKSVVFRSFAAEVEGEPMSSDSSDDDAQRKEPSTLAKMTRQERKALDREVPWRQIMKQDKETIQAYVEANIKEYKSWMSWGSIKPLTKQQARDIMSDPALKRRVIPARNAYRDKARGVPPLRPKCRTVVLGCCDPDIGHLDRESPTPTRTSEAIIIQLAISGINAKVELNNKKWRLWGGDVSTAFLQGAPDPSERPMPIYMKGPRDGIQRLAHSFPDEVYEVCGNLYGFTNAPKTWSNHVIKTLTQELHLQQHRLDKMFLYGRDERGQLNIAMIVHVDDFLVAFREDYDFEAFKKCFQWGSQTLLTLEQDIVFRGKEISLKAVDQHYEIVVTQRSFISEMASGTLGKSRKNAKEKLNESEWKDYRSCAGSLQWLGGQTRPDVCSLVSLSNKGQETSTTDLQNLYEYIDIVKQTPEVGIVYYPVALDRAAVLVGYGDSSWANAPGCKSQMGVLVIITSHGCFDRTTRGSILDWKSTRSPRVTRSTLASEANAMDECVDRSTYLNHFLTELIYPDGNKFSRLLRQVQVTDCKSLYDAVISSNPSLSEKRTIIAVRSIQDFIQPQDVRWTPTDVMWAGALTKESAELLARFHEWLKRPIVTLVDDC